MIPQKRKYIFILVHYGHPDSTDALIRALFKNKVRPDQVVVIDHAPEKYESPVSASEVSVFRPNKNDGYAAGLNIGLGTLLNNGTDKHDIVTCMNNDGTVTDNFVESIQKWWQDNPSPALMGLKKGAVNLLSGRSVIESASAMHKIPYLHGSFISAPYDVFASLHGWPDKYFLYWEDVLLSNVALKKKIPLKTSKTIFFEHDDNVRLNDSDNKTYYLVRNGALFLEKETPLFWRIWWRIMNRVRLIWHTYFNRQAKPVVGEALRDAKHGVTGKRTYE